MDRLLAKVPSSWVNNPTVEGARGLTMGMADPIVGAGQFVANVLPDATGIPQAVNKAISSKEAEYQSGRSGLDIPRIVGNIGSPINLAMALRAAPALTAGSRAIQGVGMGAVGGATAPVEVPESGKYWGQKVAQTGLGAVTGGILGPVVGLVGDKVGALVARANFDPSKAASQTDSIINSALGEAGQKASDIPAAQLNTLRSQVSDALSKGKKLDAAALMRMQDFQAEGIKPTQAWITRDPRQFADEQTMRAMSQPLTDTMAQGNAKVTRGISQYGANASEAPQAAQTLATALRSFDEGKRSAVTAAYKSAREVAGGAPEIPMQGLAQDVVGFVDQLPESVRKALPVAAFEKYGLSSGKQTKTFTYDDAENLLQTLNASRNNDPAVGRAIGKLSGFVKDAIQQGGDAGPYAGARALAAQRFATHEQVPALEAAAQGKVDDTFVQKYVINSKSTEEVQRLAKILRDQAPDAFEQTRQQIGAELTRKAFGENVSADKVVAQESYNRALRNIGTGKLEAFFQPNEVDQLRRLGRISAYQQSNPAAAATNFSNTAGALANLLRSGGGLPFAGKTLQTVGEKLGGYAATNPVVPSGVALTDAQRKALSAILAGTAGGGGLALSSRVVGQ